MTPPIFLDENVEINMKDRKKLHLVEGHTRLGILRGLIDNDGLEKNSLHRCWIGKNP